MATGRSGFHFVDVAAVLAQLNAKHEADTANNGLVMKDGRRFTNMMLEVAPFPLPKFRQGGLQSLDGMHLSTLGYGLMAQAVLDAMGTGHSLNLESVYQRDTLLQSLPRAWSWVLPLWHDIRRRKTGVATYALHEDTEDTDPAAALVNQLMETTGRFKIT